MIIRFQFSKIGGHFDRFFQYISSVENGVIESGNLSDEIRTWIKWAKEKVDWYDPLVNRVDNTLDDYDKTNVFKEFLKE